MKLFLFTFILCWSASLSAANFRVLALSKVDGLDRLEYQAGEDLEVVLISTLGFSELLPAPLSGVLDLYDKVPVEGEEKSPLLSIDILADGGDVIVLLYAVDAQRYGYLVVDDSQGAFPMGSVLVLNFSKTSIYAKFDDERVLVPSRERKVVKLTGASGDPFNAGVKFAAEFDGSGKVFSSSSWYLLPSMKIFCLIYSNPDGKPRIRRIRLT
jgi:hypothetical protein